VASSVKDAVYPVRDRSRESREGKANSSPEVSPRNLKATELVDRALAHRRGGRGTLRRVGRLHRLGGGSRHRAWRFRASAIVAGKPKQLVLVLRLPRMRRSDGRSRSFRRLVRAAREMQTLAAIEASAAEFTAPLFVCPVRTRHGTVVGMLQSYVVAKPLSSAGLVEKLACAAAAVHRLPLDKFSHLRDLTDRRDWVIRLLNAFPEEARRKFPEAADACLKLVEWTAQPASASCVVHGDLRPGNVLRALSRSAPAPSRKPPFAIVDWELARIGEPAIDLAAILRGNPRLSESETGDGLERLLTAYRQAGGSPASAVDVRMHELLLILAWLGDRWRRTRPEASRRGGNPPRDSKKAPSPEQLARELGIILERL
jgi:aminoglycoside phosphotransferase (APT) family kinase protein